MTKYSILMINNIEDLLLLLLYYYYYLKWVNWKLAKIVKGDFEFVIQLTLNLLLNLYFMQFLVIYLLSLVSIQKTKFSNNKEMKDNFVLLTFLCSMLVKSKEDVDYFD